jgi:uncharacterized membrane protein (DUF4010 family)
MDINLTGFLVALGAGLLIGIERERRKGTGPQRALAGVRSFTLVSFSGALAQSLDQPLLVLVGALFVVGLNLVAYWRSSDADPGVTTELALFFTDLIGITAMQQPVLAAGLAVATAILLAARNRLHNFSVQLLSTTELRDALVLAGAVLIVLPLLPDQNVQWLAGTNPRRLWMLAVIFMVLEAAGYIALRIAGPKLGLALSGLASGFISSTATIATLGTRSRAEPALRRPCIAGALFSCIATVVQMMLVVVAVNAPLLNMFLPTLGAGLVTAVAVASLSMRGQHLPPTDKAPSRVFNLWHAVGFALLMSVATALLALAQSRFGALAIPVGAALGGFFDAHASSASALSMVASGRYPAALALLPVLLALTSNSVSKLVVAFVAGGIHYGLRVGAGLLALLVALWLPMLVMQ